MRLKTIGLITLLVWLITPSLSAQGNGIVWEQEVEMEKILTKAQATNKLVFVLYTKPSCGYCKRLKNEILPDPQVKALLENFINLEVDIKSPAGKDLSQRNRIFSSPVSVLYDQNGEEIDRIVGYWKLDEYLTRLTDYSQNINTFNEWTKRLETDGNNPEVLYTLGIKLLDRRMDKDAFHYLEKTVEVDPMNSSDFADNALYMKASHLQRKQRNAEGAIDPLLAILNRFPQGDQAVYAFNRLLTCYTILKQPDQIVETYDKYIKVIPQEARAYRVAATELAKGWKGARYLAKAMESAKQAIKLDPNHAGNYSALSTVQDQMGDYQAALKSMNKALELDPENSRYKARQEQLKNELTD
ncbi:MAG: hypothetical protein B6244_07345 [Candidatus Cloacimonetes bacterium 4572_55]|nr:MAG: hypothetical protein B6244_07345 [Candidatus Cloacimonetes bacterium 4572_55]